MSDTLRHHPLADIFPPMEGAEFNELVADIKQNGLIEPIILLDDQILDGRNRFRACVAAGVEPTYRPFTGEDHPVGNGGGVQPGALSRIVRVRHAQRLGGLGRSIAAGHRPILRISDG